MLPTWQQLLANRGISIPAIDQRWQYQEYKGKPGWAYPVFDFSGKVIARRWKALDSSANPKYLWLQGSVSTAPYYHASDVKEAIAAAGGECHFAAGEPALLSYLAAGIRNVIAPFGENNIPAYFLADLALLGVTRLIYAPDLDDTGRSSAVKVRDAIHGSNIDYEIKRLPDSLGEKGDTNDLWQAVKFDPAAFIQAIHELPALGLPAIVRKQETSTSTISEGSPDYYKAIEKGLGITGYKTQGKSAGWSNLVKCPIRNHQHDDRRPGASWHETKHILHCQKCGATYLSKEVSAALSIRWQDFQPVAQNDQQVDLSAAPDSGPGTHSKTPRRVFDALIEKLLTLHQLGGFYDHAAAALVLVLRNEGAIAGEVDPAAPFTIQNTLDYATASGRNTNEKTIRRGFDQLTALGFYERTEAVSGGRGRPTVTYTAKPLSAALATLQEKLQYRAWERAYGQYTPAPATPAWFADQPEDIAAQLAEFVNQHSAGQYQEFATEIEQAQHRYQQLIKSPLYQVDRLLSGGSTELPPGEWATGRDFRAAYYKAQVARRSTTGRNITAVEAAAQIGVSIKTLTTIRDRELIIAEPQFITEQIQPDQPALKQVDSMARWAAGRGFGRYLESTSGKGISVNPDDPHGADEWVKREVASGHTVIAKVQTASRERFANAEEVERHKVERQAKYSPREYMAAPPKVEKLPELRIVLEAFPETFRRDWLDAQLSLRGLDAALLELAADGFALGASLEIDLIPFSTPYDDRATTSRVAKREINTEEVRQTLQSLYDAAQKDRAVS